MTPPPMAFLQHRYCTYGKHIHTNSKRIKGTVRRILRGVNTKLKKPVLVNLRPVRFSYCNLNGHNRKSSI
jgi:hypothetical protein